MVRFFTLLKVPELKSRKRLKLFIKEMFVREGKALSELTYVFCTDDYLLKINQDFLQHDFYTDIITFDLSEGSKLTEGEIYISIDRVRDNANGLNAKVSDELHRVIFHGVLHLCGYKDKLKVDRELMRKKEDYYLKRYKG